MKKASNNLHNLLCHHKQQKAVGNTAGGVWFMAAWLSAYLNHSGSGYRVCTAFACMTYTGNKNQSVLSNVMFTRHKAKHKLFWILKHKLFCILKHKLFWILKHRASCVTNIYFLIFLHELQCKLTQGPGWRIKIILQVVVESKLISKIKHYVKLMFCAIHDSPRDTSSFLKNVENILFLAEM